MKVVYKAMLVLCLTLLLVGCDRAGVDEVDALLDKVAVAYGGEERLSAATAFEQYGETVSALFRQPGRVHRAFQYPDRLRIDIRYGANNNELRILAGAMAWKQGEPATGVPYSAMLLQAARLGMPNTLLDHRDSVRDAGTIISRQGTTLRALELSFHGNLRLVAGIDPATGRILESRGIITAKRGQGMEFTAGYDDFRMIDGRLFAFRETHYAMGSEMGHTTLERIKIMHQLPAELFDGSRPERPGPDQHMAWR